MSLTAGARAPYSLRPIAFPFAALAAMGARAPMGGPRETALACLLVARIVADAIDPASGLAPEQRRARAHAARHWLGAATLAPQARAALVRLADATAAERPDGMAVALDTVMTVTANLLEPAARLDLSRLAQTLAG